MDGRITKRVLIAMSGGVDSSVACYLLKDKGYDCIGATIKTWPSQDCEKEGNKMCCSLDAINSARAVCYRMRIPHYVFDMSDHFKNSIK